LVFQCCLCQVLLIYSSIYSNFGGHFWEFNKHTTAHGMSNISFLVKYVAIYTLIHIFTFILRSNDHHNSHQVMIIIWTSAAQPLNIFKYCFNLFLVWHLLMSCNTAASVWRPSTWVTIRSLTSRIFYVVWCTATS